MAKTIVVIGGTGAQGVPVVKALSENGSYAVVVLTRDASSPRAKELAAIPGVTLVEGSYENEATLRRVFAGAYGAYVNTDGFAIGEQAEVFWGMRIFELAVEARLKHYVWSGLEYSLKLGGYDPAFRCGHYDGKGRTSEWLLEQKDTGVIVSVLTVGPYIEMLQGGLFEPQELEGGKKLVFKFPRAKYGIPMVHLDDVAYYTRWLFDNTERANFMNLKIAVAPVRFEDVVSAFNARTSKHGRTATYEPHESVSAWLDATFPSAREMPITALHGNRTKYDLTKPALGLTFYENFLGAGLLWTSDLLQRDYALLDEIHPGRVKSVEEWMDKTGYDGSKKQVMKSQQ